MSRTSFLQDLLATIFERTAPRLVGDDRRSLEELAAALISERGEASGTRLAASILDRYEKSPAGEKADFFRLLTEVHDLDAGALAAAAEAYQVSPDATTLARLVEEAEPPLRAGRVSAPICSISAWRSSEDAITCGPVVPASTRSST